MNPGLFVLSLRRYAEAEELKKRVAALSHIEVEEEVKGAPGYTKGGARAGWAGATPASAGAGLGIEALAGGAAQLQEVGPGGFYTIHAI